MQYGRRNDRMNIGKLIATSDRKTIHNDSNVLKLESSGNISIKSDFYYDK